MVTTCKPVDELTAADVMSREVIAVPKHLSLRAAARLLSGSHISGAPVIDLTGRCVGVLSTTDFAAWAGKGESIARERGEASPGACEWEIITTMAPMEELVRDWMTPAPVSELARAMIDAHVHRVIIAEEDGRPIGIVSSTDILAAVARAEHA